MKDDKPVDPELLLHAIIMKLKDTDSRWRQGDYRHFKPSVPRYHHVEQKVIELVSELNAAKEREKIETASQAKQPTAKKRGRPFLTVPTPDTFNPPHYHATPGKVTRANSTLQKETSVMQDAKCPPTPSSSSSESIVALPRTTSTLMAKDEIIEALAKSILPKFTRRIE